MTSLDPGGAESDRELIDRWDEYEAMREAPPGAFQNPVGVPELSREFAQEMHAELVAHLEKLEAAWERRN